MSISDDCPTEQELIEYCDGRLKKQRRDEVASHIADCGPCTTAEEWIKAHLLRPMDDTNDEAEQEQSDFETSSARRGPRSDSMDETQFLPNTGRVPDVSNIDHSLFSESNDDKAMGRLGKYDIFRLLGQGGMGVVLQAHNEQLRRDVAIKMLNRSLSASPVARRRFIREARAAAAINHPNVVIIHDVDEHRGVPFIVMEMVTGRTLRDEIRRETTLDPIRVVRLSTQIAQGLASAHAQGVIHRDIKPGNIMLEDDVDRVKIADFGLARAAIDNIELTSRELAVGTPAYMSPEQVGGEDVDARSDLFALGCVIHAMLTGHSPFHGRNALEMARKVETHHPLNLHKADPSIPKFLAEIVDKLLAKDPDERFQSAAEVADVLNRHLAMLNQAPSNQIAHLLRTTTLDKDSPAKKSLAPLWFGGGIVLLAAFAVFVFMSRRHLSPVISSISVEAGSFESTGSEPPENGQPGIEPAGLELKVDDPALSPQLLTVSQTASANFRTLGEALAKAKAGDTIRVLDDATYVEAVLVGGNKHKGIKLVSEQRATLALPTDANHELHTLTLIDAVNVTVQGFDIQSAGRGHAVFIKGSTSGVVLDDLRCENTATTGPYATIQIFVSSADPAGTPLCVRNCQIVNQGVSQCVWLHEPAHPVVISGNSFSSKGANLILWKSCQRLEISHNAFLDGEDGIALQISEWTTNCHVQITNNTFISSRAWLALGDSPLAGGNVEVANNLILGSELLDMTEQQQIDATRDWQIHDNHWERGTRTLASVGRQGAIATMHEPDTLGISTNSNDDDFLIPPPGSELLSAGRGNGVPTFVGAKDRVE